MPIRVLPPAIAARIAAGEVIERPASVVKELVENSIDAGASSIEVEIRHGGLAMIRITDNGCGIDASEVALAFQRHATSKITDVDDLDTIGTFGFRGEALASIAAAAVVRMTTRTQEAAAATAIELEGGVVVRQGEASAAQGTTIEVETLFSTIPARMKFIRSAAAETARSRQAMDHLAMANPHVRFTFKTDGKTQLATSGNGNLRDVVAAVHGAELAGKMIEIGSWAGPYPVWGLTSSPEHSRANRTGISMFISGRWIFSRTISVALEDAYRGLLMEGRFPLAAIFVDVPPPEVDVNVHPNKREVRLLRDGDVFSSVQHAVRDALLAESPVADAGELLSQAQPTETPFASQAFEPAFELTTVAPQGSLAPLPEPGPVADPEAGSSPLLSPSPLRNLRVLGQISNTYIVAEGPGGMYLIDQHAAHESVLYYRLLRQWSGSAPDVQPMLEPMPVELTPIQLDAANDARGMLERYGLILEPFGEGAWLVRAVPAMARRVDIGRMLTEALDGYILSRSNAPETHLAVAASIACHSAVRAGQSLDYQEMAALSDAIASEGNPQHCPHGRPTVVRVSNDSLEKQFGRT